MDSTFKRQEESTQIEEEKEVFLGWLIFEPIYVMWAVEIIYFVVACWICLSTTYWCNYDGLTKKQVLQILKLKILNNSSMNRRHQSQAIVVVGFP